MLLSPRKQGFEVSSDDCDVILTPRNMFRCRRNLIAEHFDEAWETADCAGMCDHCRIPREVKMLDLTDYGDKLLMILQKSASLDQRLTGKAIYTTLDFPDKIWGPAVARHLPNQVWELK